MKTALLAPLVVGIGCGTFQDPNVVVDLRVLAMTATPPEQIVDVDLRNPAPAIDLFDQLVATDVCALVADPNFTRRLRWSMVACNLDGAERCPADGRPQIKLGEGLLDDPEVTRPEPPLCVTVPANGNLFGLLVGILGGDTLHGLGGIDYGVSLRIGGENADPELDLYAAKTVQVAPRIPMGRTANTNPRLDGVFATVDGGLSGPIALGRCADQTTPLEVAPGQKIRLMPLEPDGVREVYVTPAIDGTSRTFTEALTYQWIAAAGSFSSGDTGGPHDPFGNPAPLFSNWTAPAAADLTGPTAVPIWIVQRDERFGAQWYETCVLVVP